VESGLKYFGLLDLLLMDDYEITEQRIRELAYKLWEEHGKPYGSANRFWEHAEARLREKAKSNIVTIRIKDDGPAPARPKAWHQAGAFGPQCQDRSASVDGLDHVDHLGRDIRRARRHEGA
jgi:Protein of unknown function (DUF2934)